MGEGNTVGGDWNAGTWDGNDNSVPFPHQSVDGNALTGDRNHDSGDRNACAGEGNIGGVPVQKREISGKNAKNPLRLSTLRLVA